MVVMQARDPSHRIDMPCHGCGTFDKAPRHRVLNGDGTVTVKHLDCCEADGCVDGSCTRILEAAGRVKNDELVSYVSSLAPGQHADPEGA